MFHILKQDLESSIGRAMHLVMEDTGETWRGNRYEYIITVDIQRGTR